MQLTRYFYAQNVGMYNYQEISRMNKNKKYNETSLIVDS